MPQLQWNAQDVLECLAVLPEVGEHEEYHSYTVEEQGLILLLTLWKYESVMQVILQQQGQEKPIISFALVVPGAVTRKKDRWGDYLLVQDCITVPDRFYYMNWLDVFDRDRYPYIQDVGIVPYPQILIRFEAKKEHW